MDVISIAIADDHRVVTRSLQAYLESFPDLRVVGTASSGEELLHHLSQRSPSVVLQDLLMPGGLDGIQTIRQAVEQLPRVRIVALTASNDESRMMGALRAGAAGYVRKDSEPEILLAAVRAVAQGKTYIDPSVSRLILRAAAAPEELTAREIEVLHQVILGKTNKEIAKTLAIREETVKTHVGRVLSKLEAENRAQAIVQALRRGLVWLDDLPGAEVRTARRRL